MKKQKAFTLIELLAVIVILAVIALIASPIIMNVIGKTKKQAFEQSIDGILEAVRLDYAVEGFTVPREYFYNKGDLTLLKLGEEVQNKSVAIKGKIDGNGFIYVDEEGIRIDKICNSNYCVTGKEDNIIITENEEGKVPEYEITDPKIELNGEKIIYIGLNETYTELGATSKTIGGQKLEYTTEITLNGEVVTSIDTSIENTYVITYQATNEGKIATVTRNVVVINMTPVITITEANSKYVKEQEILMTASAVRPNMITELSYKIKKGEEVIKSETISGPTEVINLNETGIYEIEVNIKDSGNHTKSMTSGVYKIDQEAPTIEFTKEITLKANEVSGFVLSEDDTVKVNDNSNLVTLEIEGNLNSTIVEDQEITYIAIDEAGNETRKTRVFHIDPADGPTINFSSPGSNGIWINATTITLYARIEVENDELTAFTYQVDNGQVVNVPITNNKSMDVDVALNTTGRHTVKITATGKHKNTTPLSLGEFLIDVTAPTVGAINGNTDSWTANKVLTSTLSDANSSVKYYALIKNNAAKPAANSSEWKTIATASSSYRFSGTVTANGTYYLWAKDGAGNISATSASVTINKIDETTPALTVNNYTGKYGDSRELSKLYTATYGAMGGSTTCKSGNTVITNAKDINTAGTNTIKCTALGKNGKSTEKNITITLASNTFTELMTVKTFSEVMTTNVTTDPWNNKRYVGANPSNYVEFNDELWRIVGLFNGQIKLVRNETIGNKVMNTTNLNIWAQAPLQQELNGSYWNSIDPISQQYVDTTHVWNVGGYSATTGTRTQFYNAERGTTVYAGHPTTWSGKIGLLYPSDYGYSTSSTIAECDSTGLYNWTTTGNVAACRTNSWLSTGTYWTMTPNSANEYFTFVVYNNTNFGLGWENAIYASGVRPVVYLKSNVKIRSGAGTSSNPYKLTIADDIANNDPGKNYRYVGNNPNNYVKFNNELWRIIGVFDGGQAKIVKMSTFNGQLNAWSTSNINNWETSTLRTALNGTYLNNIEANSRNYIEQHTWQLGGWTTPQVTRKDMYNYERGNTVYTGNKTSLPGKVGLIYPSDYAYASNGGSICETTKLSDWNSSSAHNECARKSWLFQANTNYMTLTPRSDLSNYVYYIYSYTDSTYDAVGGELGVHTVDHAGVAYPTVYLKTTTKIVGGAGTSSNPYILGT